MAIWQIIMVIWQIIVNFEHVLHSVSIANFAQVHARWDEFSNNLHPTNMNLLIVIINYLHLNVPSKVKPNHFLFLHIYLSPNSIISTTYLAKKFALNVPNISESCIEIKIKLNVYFHTSLWCIKRFYEDFKGLHTTF